MVMYSKCKTHTDWLINDPVEAVVSPWSSNLNVTPTTETIKRHVLLSSGGDDK